MKQKRSQQSGFTLIELAIVIVIIGLLVGGILVGQDLIKAAGISATVRQVGEINSAATTFRTKYNGLPGDLLNTKAVQFGFNAAATDANRDGTGGKGDGNGVIEGCSSASPDFGCESVLFWVDVTKAGLLPGQSTFSTSAGVPSSMVTLVPPTKLRDSTLVSIFNNNGRNYLSIGSMSVATAATAAGSASTVTYVADTATAGLTPREARGIDEKLDDSNPLTGTIVAIKNGTDPRAMNEGTSSPTDNACVNGQQSSASKASYTADTDKHQDNLACAISVRTAF